MEAVKQYLENGVVKELTEEEIERLLKNTDDMLEGARGVDDLADISKYLDDVNEGGSVPDFYVGPNGKALPSSTSLKFLCK